VCATNNNACVLRPFQPVAGEIAIVPERRSQAIDGDLVLFVVKGSKVQLTDSSKEFASRVLTRDRSCDIAQTLAEPGHPLALGESVQLINHAPSLNRLKLAQPAKAA
jgi:hypothetical protein